MKRFLITGGAGFIGSNFIEQILSQCNDIEITNVDKLTYAGSQENLRKVTSHSRYSFIQGDICDQGWVNKIFKDYQFDSLIHFAAESHVDNSIHRPAVFIETNILGTFHLLEAARDLWLEKPFEVARSFESSRFIHISTDEVYGSLGRSGFFTEETPYSPNSPYSASKASSDMLVRSYFHTYGLKTIITNCSNNYGPKQHDEKLIPTIIRKALAKKKIPIYGDGQNIRDWLYVLDHCTAIMLAYEKGLPGETYNIGTRNERTNLEMAQHICLELDQMLPKQEGLDSYTSLISFVQDRPGHDRRYAIDPTKIEQLGFKAEYDFKEALGATIKWYIEKYGTK